MKQDLQIYVIRTVVGIFLSVFQESIISVSCIFRRSRILAQHRRCHRVGPVEVHTARCQRQCRCKYCENLIHIWLDYVLQKLKKII